MDTMVNVQVISDQPRAQVEQAVQRAFAWFDTVEHICTRFDPASEVMRLIGSAGRPLRVSTLIGVLVPNAALAAVCSARRQRNPALVSARVAS